MMDALVVLNINSFMPPIARAHFKDAAMRWGVEYVEIMEPLDATRHHFWQKAMIPLSSYTLHYERILQLDADMLVAADCPSPFAAVKSDHFGVVSTVQPGRYVRHIYNFNVPQWSRHYKVEGYKFPWQHLNAGLLLYNRNAHYNLLWDWQRYAESGTQRPACPMPEQFVLSCLLARGTLPVTWMDWRFNACRGVNGTVPRDAYIAHFHAPRQRPLATIMGGFHFQRGSNMKGPGTHLRDLIVSWLGNNTGGCGGCEQLLEEMNRNGPEWCRQKMNYIAPRIRANARKSENWKAKILSRLPGVQYPIRAMVLLAIRHAEAEIAAAKEKNDATPAANS